MSEEARLNYENVTKDLVGKTVRVNLQNREKALTDVEDFSLTEIPYEALKRVGKVFKEGLKYGKGNWRKGVNDKKFQLERANHALKHLLIYIHELETGEYLYPSNEVMKREDDLAKVMWFCMIMCELERLET